MRKLILLALLVIAACSSQATPPTIEATIEPQQTAPTTESPVTVAPTEAPVSQAATRPALQTVALTNARTGATFQLADFAGKTVLVEPMATWCTNCRAQLGNVIQAKNQLDENYVFVVLSVGENISDSDLAAYAERQGFDLIFAIATPEMLTELTNAFGRASLTPPSTPHFIIRPDGSQSALFTGSKPADQLVAVLTEGA